MPESVFLGAQIINVVGRWFRLKRYLLDDFDSVNFEPADFFGIVGENPDLFETEVSQYLCADAVVAFVRRKTQFQIRVNGVKPFFLQLVGVQLVFQPDAPSFLPQIYQRPMPACSIIFSAAANCCPHSHL